MIDESTLHCFPKILTTYLQMNDEAYIVHECSQQHLTLKYIGLVSAKGHMVCVLCACVFLEVLVHCSSVFALFLYSTTFSSIPCLGWLNDGVQGGLFWGSLQTNLLQKSLSGASLVPRLSPRPDWHWHWPIKLGLTQRCWLNKKRNQFLDLVA